MEYPIKTKYVGIELTQNKIAVIDTEQYYLKNIGQYKNWFAHTKNDGLTFYAKTHVDKKQIYLHNLIMNHNPRETDENLTVDHKNRLTLDSRIQNLRIVPPKIQQRNQGIRKKNTTGFRGVSFQESDNPDHEGYFVCSWRENKETKNKAFSISKYGYDIAFEKAVEYRLLIELFIPEYRFALCLDEKLDYFDFDNILNNPDVTIIYKDGLNCKNTSGKANLKYIDLPNNQKKIIITYFNEKGQRTKKTFYDENESIDFQNMMKKYHPKYKIKIYPCDICFAIYHYKILECMICKTVHCFSCTYLTSMMCKGCYFDKNKSQCELCLKYLLKIYECGSCHKKLCTYCYNEDSISEFEGCDECGY